MAANPLSPAAERPLNPAFNSPNTHYIPVLDIARELNKNNVLLDYPLHINAPQEDFTHRIGYVSPVLYEDAIAVVVYSSYRDTNGLLRNIPRAESNPLLLSFCYDNVQMLDGRSRYEGSVIIPKRLNKELNVLSRTIHVFSKIL